MVSCDKVTPSQPIRESDKLNTLNRFIIGFFFSTHTVHLSAKSISREVNQSIPQVSTALSTIEIVPLNFGRPTFSFTAAVTVVTFASDEIYLQEDDRMPPKPCLTIGAEQEEMPRAGLSQTHSLVSF